MMKQKQLQCVLWFASFLMLIVGCQSDEPSCEYVERQGKQYCVIAKHEITETGYDCPVEFAYQHIVDDMIVCSHDASPPQWGEVAPPVDVDSNIQLSVDAPIDGQMFTTQNPVFYGNVTPFKNVLLSLDEVPLAVVRANEQGQWRYAPVQPLEYGSYQLTISNDLEPEAQHITRVFHIERALTGAHLQSKTFGGNSTSAIIELDVDAQGHLYCGGFFAGQMDFGQGMLTAKGNNDAVVYKHSVNGLLMWVKRWGGLGKTRITSLKVHPQGGVVVAGHFSDDVDFDHGQVTSYGEQSAFVSRLNDDGTVRWTKVFQSTELVEANRLAVDLHGTVALIGHFTGRLDFGMGSAKSSGSSDVYVMAFDASGTVKWHRIIGGTSRDKGLAAAYTPNGHLVIGGSFRAEADFGQGLLSADNQPGRDSAYLAMYDAQGQLVWGKRLGGRDSDAVRTIAVDSQGNIIVGGFFYSRGDFGHGMVSSPGGYGHFIAKYKSNGLLAWLKVLDVAEYAELRQIHIDKQDHVLVTASFQDYAKLGTSYVASQGQSDSFVVKYDAHGCLLWHQAYGGTGSVVGYSISTLPDQSIVVGGYFEGFADLGDGQVESQGYRDVFLKYMSP